MRDPRQIGLQAVTNALAAAPAKKSSKTGWLVYLGLFAFVAVAAIYYGAVNPKPPSAEAQFEAHDDVALQWVANAIRAGNAVSSVSRSGSLTRDYFDVTIGSRDLMLADNLAGRLCDGYFRGDLALHYQHNVRVYLVDGSLASQCEIARTLPPPAPNPSGKPTPLQ